MARVECNRTGEGVDTMLNLEGGQKARLEDRVSHSKGLGLRETAEGFSLGSGEISFIFYKEAGILRGPIERSPMSPNLFSLCLPQHLPFSTPQEHFRVPLSYNCNPL